MRLGSQWALLCLALNVSGNALHAGEQDPVEALLQQMTLEEKVRSTQPARRPGHTYRPGH